MEILFAALLGFFSGSIPFGLLLTRAAGLGDVRDIGSGSIGATNVLRTGNKWLAVGTLLGDAIKGVIPVLVAEHLWSAGGIAAIAAVAGHCFTPWLKFKGGKGFATAAGVLGALHWPLMLLCAGIWAATIAVSRISSVASMTTVVLAPAAAWLFGHEKLVAPLIAIAAIVLIQHRANIGRLLKGEEPKVGGKK